MGVSKITNNIHFVGVIDWDRRIFDELIPLPGGTSYNSYLITGSEKVALIDTVDTSKTEILLRNLERLNVKKIDYIIANHAEQDHSGAIPVLLEKYKEALVVTNKKCALFLKDLLHIPDEKIKVIKDEEELSLGNLTLKFYLAPWVHWPETMFTFVPEEKILFTCDFLGAHIASSKLFVEDDPKIYESAKLYYAQIMMPFRNHIEKHLKLVESLNPSMIAPSHGLIYKKPEFIINGYKKWISHSQNREPKVIIPYISMHHSTAYIVECLVSMFMEKGILVKPYNLIKTDFGEFSMSLVDATAIIFASPTVLGGAHPMIVYAATLINTFRPRVKIVGFTGSYSWGGRMVDQLKSILGNLKVKFAEPLLIKGAPRKEDFTKFEKLVDEIIKLHE